MSSISGSSKSRITRANAATSNISNLADLGNNVQKSSLISGIIHEVRPGGDVIVETPKGKIRANCNMPVSEGDKAKVRLVTSENGNTKAEIFSVLNTDGSTSEEIYKPTFINYIKNIFSPEQRSLARNSLNASFSYISPNLKVLDFGHIRPGNNLKIEIVEPEDVGSKTHIITGSIISNEGNSLMVNTEIGILNISAKSNLEPGQKILINMLQTPNTEKSEAIRNLISTLMSNVAQNIELLKKILEARKSIASRTGYKNLLKLYLSPHDSAILARIFHQSSEIPASEVAHWIEHDIVKPFEDAAQNYRLGFLGNQFTEIRQALEEACILPREEWREVNIPIQDTPHYATLRTKRLDKTITFNLSITHDQFGEITLDGFLELNMTNNSISNFKMSVKHGSALPEMLMSNIKSIFNDHLATSNIKGEMAFSALESAR